MCEAKGLIDKDGHLTEKALEILNEKDTYLVKTKKKVSVAVLGEDYLDKVREYREYFPEGKLPHGAVARQNVQQLKERFVWFFKTYPEFDWDLVLEAAKYYRFCKERENFMYMQTSSYFIKKTDPRTRDTTSGLADYCQMILDRPSILIDETNM